MGSLEDAGPDIYIMKNLNYSYSRFHSLNAERMNQKKITRKTNNLTSPLYIVLPATNKFPPPKSFFSRILKIKKVTGYFGTQSIAEYQRPR